MKNRICSSLADVLDAYAKSQPARFHMPGHKGQLCSPTLSPIAPFDVTEIDGTDDLHSPDGVILGLEERLADVYGAKACILSVNGSTAGNISMLLSLGIEKRVLVDGNCHRSVLSGIALCGHDAIPVRLVNEFGVITPEQVALELSKQKIDAVFITSPNYYGFCADIPLIADIVHSHGAKLFVDAAHGASFPFCPDLPPVPHEADAWVVSCHKTLNAMTQTSILCIGKRSAISVNRLRYSMSLIESSSPSYILLLSVENALNNVGDWSRHYARILDLRKRLSRINGISLLDGSPAFFDKTRLCISVCGKTGYELSRELSEFGIIVEMADMLNVVLITTPNDPDEWYLRLEHALERIDKRSKEQSKMPPLPTTFYTRQKLCVREAMLKDCEQVELCDSVGRVSASAVGSYPPGTALLFPGELICNEQIDYLNEILSAGGKLFGAEGIKISVVKED